MCEKTMWEKTTREEQWNDWASYKCPDGSRFYILGPLQLGAEQRARCAISAQRCIPA
jgi:hypothetical protein